eukprot:366327-Chlamydomonas_euryale.AAC.8
MPRSLVLSFSAPLNSRLPPALIALPWRLPPVPSPTPLPTLPWRLTFPPTLPALPWRLPPVPSPNPPSCPALAADLPSHSPRPALAAGSALSQDAKTVHYKNIVESAAEARPGVLELMDEGLARDDIAMCICSAATKAGFEKGVAMCICCATTKAGFEGVSSRAHGRVRRLERECERALPCASAALPRRPGLKR